MLEHGEKSMMEMTNLASNRLWFAAKIAFNRGGMYSIGIRKNLSLASVVARSMLNNRN